jgi:hypothetical protein
MAREAPDKESQWRTRASGTNVQLTRSVSQINRQAELLTIS